MLVIRSTIVGKDPSSFQALTIAGEEESADPRGVLTLVHGYAVRLRGPFSLSRCRALLLRYRLQCTLSILLRVVPLLIPASLLLLLPDLLRDPLASLFLRRTLPGLLFWSGSAGALFLSFLKACENGQRPLPIRSLDEGLPSVCEENLSRQARDATSLRLDRYLKSVVLRAFSNAVLRLSRRGGGSLRPVHLLRACLDTEEGRVFLRRCGIGQEPLLKRLQRIEQQTEGERRGSASCDAASYALLHLAFLEAYRECLPSVGILECIVACLRREPLLQQAFLDLSVSPDDAAHVAAWVRFSTQTQGNLKTLRELAARKPRGSINLAFTSRLTPILDSFTLDLTQAARAGQVGMLLGRDDTLREIFRVLQGTLGNVLLVGDPGCGKSEILLGLAQLMAGERIPDMLQDSRLLRLDPGSLIAGAGGVGGIEGRIRAMIGEATVSGNILLAIEDIHHLLGAGSTKSSEDAGSILMNALSEGQFHVIATTTTREFAEFIRPRPAFLRRFQVVSVPEMDRDGTIRVLEAASLQMEARHAVSLTFAALAAAYEMTARYMPDHRFPDKALKTLDEACALARQLRGKGATVGREDVARVIEDRTSANAAEVTDREAGELLMIEEELRRRVVGQDEALTAVGAALRRARTNLRRSDRPVSVLLFLGPTGVGKTETAKAIASLSFRGEERLIRLDLSEYQTPSSLEKLLGATGKTSFFLDAVRRNPAHLLLLDEFEKACPDVLNVFLQIFEDGRLTDGRGQTVAFTEALIIATSNLGSLRVHEGIAAGKTFPELREEVIRLELLRTLRPELVNRFDRIILFRPLLQSDMPLIVRLQLKPLSEALERQGIVLQALPEAVEHLARRGFDPLFGARGLRRLIQDTIEDEVAKLLLSRRMQRRDVITLGDRGAIAVRPAEVLV